MTEHELNGLFQPKGIAVIGASNNPLKAGCIIINNMIKGKFPGKLYPVNQSEENVAGLKTYARLSDIDDVVELVVLITPASAIYSIMDDLDERMASKNDVRFIVCAAADYAETKTEEGIKRQERLMQAKDKYGIRIIGPNCIGVIDTVSRVNTTFVDTGVSEDRFGPPGGISFISQSGSVAASILAWGASKVIGIRYNKFISVGNMADIDFIDLLEFLEQDPSTKVIGIYMEGYQNGKQLIKVMGRIARKKPIIILKVGRSSKGSVAANSHTSSMSGSD
ncbi:MAG TPA: CoA-binding protein, partial [Anaerolineaceae bacterium]|nr:CoA-binding protein [Anaerolineaceae bacterium]